MYIDVFQFFTLFLKYEKRYTHVIMNKLIWLGKFFYKNTKNIRLFSVVNFRHFEGNQFLKKLNFINFSASHSSSKINSIYQGWKTCCPRAE